VDDDDIKPGRKSCEFPALLKQLLGCAKDPLLLAMADTRGSATVLVPCTRPHFDDHQGIPFARDNIQLA
jgi:hypothetical protein